jgi:hypothetical protein
MGCTSSDADHFLKFQHTPLTQRASLLRKRSDEHPAVRQLSLNNKPSHALLLIART